MGILKFHKFIKDKYPEAFSKNNHSTIYDYIYIDCNYILHGSITDFVTETEFLKNIFSKFDHLLCNFIAKQEIFFAIDGTSNFAKILLQRQRRQNISELNSLWITPGTNTMQKIEEQIKKYLTETEKKYKFIHPKFILSPSDIPDEGEIKICKRLIDNYNINKNSKNLIIGNDADIIVLSMAVHPITNIDILTSGTEIVNLNKLLKCHNKILDTNQNIRADFVILSILMRDDYFPKIKFVTFEKIWEAYTNIYKLYQQPLITNNQFNKDILIKFLENLCINISKQFRKTDLIKFKKNQIKNYLEGLLWCLNLYSTGICSKYDYYYSGPGFHPNQILIYLLMNPEENFNIPKSDIKPLPAHVQSLIVLPKKAQLLILEKYRSLMDSKLKYLYEYENCEICSDLNKKINQIKLESDLENIDIYNKLHLLKIELKEHKKNHKQFKMEDIYNIVQICNF